MSKPVNPASVAVTIICAVGLSMLLGPVVMDLLKHRNPPILTDAQFADTARYALQSCEAKFNTRCYVTAAPIPRMDK